MMRRPTPSQLIWPDDPADSDLPVRWAMSVAIQILDWTWRAFDTFLSTNLLGIDLTQPLEQVERDLVRIHFTYINSLWATETQGFSSITPHHEYPEMESLTSPAARPPAYDLAFVSISNPRWAWPIEAKVVSSPNSLAAYLHDVNDKFIGGIAAPLVGEGAMIGYLLSDDTTTFCTNLEHNLNQQLEVVPEFANRSHRCSHHSRTGVPELRLHHMLMACVQ